MKINCSLINLLAFIFTVSILIFHVKAPKFNKLRKLVKNIPKQSYYDRMSELIKTATKQDKKAAMARGEIQGDNNPIKKVNNIRVKNL